MSKEIAPSQQNEEAKTKAGSGAERLLMSIMLQKAAIEGNRGVLIQLLDLDIEEDTHDYSEVTIDHLDSAPTDIEVTKKIAEYKNQLQSVTHLGDTVLHVLVTNKHNELACMVFQKDNSLLKACNKMLETPLHSAAKVGNMEVIAKLIELAPSKVKDALREKNSHGETVLHEVAKHGRASDVGPLIRFDPEIAYEVNNEGLSPLYIATIQRRTSLVKTMLENAAGLAYIPDSNGSYPIHVAARMGNEELVTEFMRQCLDSAKLMDHRRRNLLHIAAEENELTVITLALTFQKDNTHVGEIVAGMINATDYEGNTPLHIAAMKGNMKIMRAIFERMNPVEQAVRNNDGQTPFDLSVIQLKHTTTTKDMTSEITKYIEQHGRYFTPKWFQNVMRLFLILHRNREMEKNKRERVQVMGLGSVLITTVTFAAAFTVPGGFDQGIGTPILGRKYFFRAFVIANTLAFAQAFVSLFTLIFSSSLRDPTENEMVLAMGAFNSAACSMVVAFGLGSYVTLAPVNMHIAIVILVVTSLLGSPAIMVIYAGLRGLMMQLIFDEYFKIPEVFIDFALFAWTLPLIFGLAFLPHV